MKGFVAKDTDLGVSQGYNCLLFAHTRGLETDWSGKRLGSPLHPGCPELTAPPVAFSFPKWTLPSSRKTLWCNVSSKLWSCWHRSHPGARYEHFGCTEQLESSETVRKFSVWHHCLHHTTEIPLSNLPDFHKRGSCSSNYGRLSCRSFPSYCIHSPPHHWGRGVVGSRQLFRVQQLSRSEFWSFKIIVAATQNSRDLPGPSAWLCVEANHLPRFLSPLLPPQITDRVSNVIYRIIHFGHSSADPSLHTPHACACYQSFVRSQKPLSAAKAINNRCKRRTDSFHWMLIIIVMLIRQSVCRLLSGSLCRLNLKCRRINVI